MIRLFLNLVLNYYIKKNKKELIHDFSVSQIATFYYCFINYYLKKFRLLKFYTTINNYLLLGFAK